MADEYNFDYGTDVIPDSANESYPSDLTDYDYGTYDWTSVPGDDYP